MIFFTSEQHMIKKMVADFSEKEVAAAVPNMEKGEFPRGLLKQMADLGLMGIPVPQAYGGGGLDFVSYMIAIHEISKVSPALGVILSVHTSVGTNPIVVFGTEDQKQKYVKKLATGEYLGAFCLTEPSAGSDAASLKTKAERKGDHYLLNGSKLFITNGGEADIYVVFARIDPNEKRTSAFIIEKDMPGFSVGKKEKKLGIRSSPTTEIIFEDCRVPKENLLGNEGEGFKVAMMTLDGGRNGIAAQAVGIAQGALDAAVAYAKERQQFGKPIISQQGIAFKLADMATSIEAARLLTYQAAWLESQGLPYGKESAMSKLYAGDTAMKVTTEAVQVFGGYGYTKDYPVERFMRDAKITQIYEGTQEIQRLVISRYLAK
ncbi:acyl-CoA dehydrogenase [Priestia megaterium]|uniref:acyl-CoA dehydrogenase n=1 Tax=Priestia megaterium TaxID=1404 RepID=UPI00300A9E37